MKTRKYNLNAEMDNMKESQTKIRDKFKKNIDVYQEGIVKAERECHELRVILEKR